MSKHSQPSLKYVFPALNPMQCTCWQLAKLPHSSTTEDNQAQSHTQSQKLTAESCSRIPNGPSNVDMYVIRREPAEDLSVGRMRDGREERVARELADWDAQWRTLSGRQS